MKGFRVLQPFAGVYHIECAGASVFVTLLCGTHSALLVDTGLGVGDLAGQVRELTNLPLTVLNTHAHNDHIAGNYQFDTVLLHPADMPYARVAMSIDIKNKVRELLQPDKADYDDAAYEAYNLENIRPLSPHAVFDLGGLTARIVPIGTHTPGSVGVYVPGHKLLLTGDCIATMLYLFFPESCSRAALLAAMDALERELPFEHMLASHCEQPLARSRMALFRECVQSYDPRGARTYRDPFFPRYKGKMYAHSWSADPRETAYLIGRPDDVPGGG